MTGLYPAVIWTVIILMALPVVTLLAPAGGALVLPAAVLAYALWAGYNKIAGLVGLWLVLAALSMSPLNKPSK